MIPYITIRYQSQVPLGTVVYRGGGPQDAYTAVFVLRQVDDGGIFEFNYDYYVVTGYLER
jgi:hypothetical protein